MNSRQPCSGLMNRKRNRLVPSDYGNVTDVLVAAMGAITLPTAGMSRSQTPRECLKRVES